LLTTNNPEYVRTARILRDWGQEQKYYHVLKGFNYRMDGLQGAILRVKLRHLEERTEARRSHAAQYNRILKGAAVTTPVDLPYARHVYHVYAVLAADRNALQAALNAQGIQTSIHYPIPVHLQSGYSDLGYKQNDFPVAERAAREVISLPMFA